MMTPGDLDLVLGNPSLLMMKEKKIQDSLLTSLMAE